MSEVFDLDALASETTDDEGEPFPFRFGGESYELPPQFPMLALAAISAGELGDGLRILLGNDQWQRMLHAKATFNEKMLKALLEQYSAHVGSSLGESSASTGSSKSTGGPSKPISNGSTGSGSPTSSSVGSPGVVSASL